MMDKTFLFRNTFLILILLLYGFPLQGQEFYEEEDTTKDSAFTKVNAEAIFWLNLIDQKQYGPSWREAAPLFQKVITEKQWVGAMQVTRFPLGVVTMRKVASQRKLPPELGGVKGDFMGISFETDFSDKPNALEKLTLMYNGRWRVIAYEIS